MNSTRLGVFAAAALTVLATQASANEGKKAAKSAKDMVCTNSCKTDAHACAGHELKKDAMTKEACEKASGKWMAKAYFEKNTHK